MSDEPGVQSDNTNATQTGAPGDVSPSKSRAGTTKRPARKATGATKKTTVRDAKETASASIPTRTGRPSKNDTVVQQLTMAIAILGSLVGMVDEFDGKVVVEHASAMADSLATIAEGNPQVQKALNAMNASAGWSGVVVTFLPVLVAILANHHALPRSWRSMAGIPFEEDPEPVADEATPAGTEAPAPGLTGISHLFAQSSAAA